MTFSLEVCCDETRFTLLVRGRGARFMTQVFPPSVLLSAKGDVEDYVQSTALITYQINVIEMLDFS
jgi:hypothetical protein